MGVGELDSPAFPFDLSLRALARDGLHNGYARGVLAVLEVVLDEVAVDFEGVGDLDAVVLVDDVLGDGELEAAVAGVEHDAAAVAHLVDEERALELGDVGVDAAVGVEQVLLHDAVAGARQQHEQLLARAYVVHRAPAPAPVPLLHHLRLRVRQRVQHLLVPVDVHPRRRVHLLRRLRLQLAAQVRLQPLQLHPYRRRAHVRHRAALSPGDCRTWACGESVLGNARWRWARDAKRKKQ